MNKFRDALKICALNCRWIGIILTVQILSDFISASSCEVQLESVHPQHFDLHPLQDRGLLVKKFLSSTGICNSPNEKEKLWSCNGCDAGSSSFFWLGI